MSEGSSADRRGLHAAIGLYRAGRLGEAGRVCEMMTVSAPDAADPWHLLGHVFLAQKDVKQAILCLKRALTLAPGARLARISLMRALHAAGRDQEAIRLLDELAETTVLLSDFEDEPAALETLPIPKVIHQIWLGNQDIRPEPWMRTWMEQHPDWEYRLWTDDNVPALRCQAQFDAMADPAGKADILRYELLHDLGGIYIDADAVCLRPLDDLLRANDSFCCWESEYARPGIMANGFLGACPGNELMRALVDGIASRTDMGGEPWQVVGPTYFTDMVTSKLRYTKLRIYPSYYFLPLHLTGIGFSGWRERAYADHFWGTTRNLYGGRTLRK